jgi:hypothetical protein
MQNHITTRFDPQTIALLKAALEEAWKSLAPNEQAKTAKSVLAERILKQAAAGERDRKKLIRAALAAGDLAA